MSEIGKKTDQTDDPLKDLNSRLDAMIGEEATVEGDTLNTSLQTNPNDTLPTDPAAAPPTAGAQKAAPSVQSDPLKAQKRSIGQDLKTAGSALLGAAVGAIRSPLAAIGAVGDAAVDASDAIFDNTLLPFGEYLDKAPERFPGQKAIAASILAEGSFERKGSFADTLSARKYLGQIGQPAVNQGVAQLGSLVLGTVAAAETKLLSALPKVARYGLAAGASEAILLDPHATRVSTMMQGLGVRNEFVDWLAGDQDDTMMEGRFKNALEGTGLGAATEGLFLGAKWLWALKNAPELAPGLKAEADAALKDIIPENAQPGPTITSVTPEGAVVRDGEPVVQFATKEQYDGLVDAAADGSYSLQRVDEAALPEAPDQFAIMKGDARIGFVYGRYDAEAKKFNVFNVQANEGAGSLGTTATRNLLKQIRKEYPDATAIGGERISGARGKINPDFQKGPEVEVALPPLNDPDNVAPLLRQMAIDLHDTPHIIKTDAEMYTRAEQISREVGLDTDTMMKAAQQISGNMTDIDSAVTAMRGSWGAIAKDVTPWAMKGIDNVAESEMPALKQAIHNAITFSGYFANVRSQSGRLLRSLGMEDLNGYLAKNVDEAVTGPFANAAQKPLPQTKQEIGDWLEMWRQTEGRPDVRMDFLQGVQALPSAFKYLRTSFANHFTASALSGIPSVMMNTVGPAIVGVLHTTEKTLGGAVAAMLTRDPARRQELLATSKYAAQAYLQTIGDIPNVMQYAIQAMQSNRSILGGGGTVNDIVTNMGPITPAMIRTAQGGDAPVWGYALGNAINFLPRQFQRLNSGLDEFSKRLSYNGEVRLKASVEASQQGLKGQQFKDYVRRSMLDAVEDTGPSIGGAANADLLRTAERTTFTGSFDSGYHPIAERGAQYINYVRREFPEARYIMPVFNVPANAVGETMRRLPGVNFLLKETREELMGDLGAVRQADAYGRTMLAGMFLMMGYSMAREGTLTGAGPTDPRDRRVWEQTKQPYSMKVGDKWVNYARYDLPGSLLALPAVMFDRTVNRTSTADWEMASVGFIGALAQYFKDKAAMQGVSQFLDFGSSPSSDLGYFERTLGNVGARMAVPNFVTQLGRNVQDPARRQRASIGDYLADALPWSSQELDPVRNIFGEPQFKPNQTIIENALPITISSTKADDKVLTEIDRLYEATGYGPGVTLPSEISGGSKATGYYDPREVKLENGRSLFDAVIAARQGPLEEAGDGESPLRTALADLFQSDEYREANDGDAGTLYDSNGEVSRAALVRRVFSDYNRAAQRKVAAESPIARRYLAVGAAKRINGDALRGHSVQKLVDTPDLLKALDINIEDFEDRLQ